MLGNTTKLEVKIDGKIYLFLCDPDSPIGAVHDSLCAMKQFVIQRIQDANKSEECTQGECEDG